MTENESEIFDCCDVCGKIYRVPKKYLEIHSKPEDDSPGESEYYEENVYPHYHIKIPLCPECIKQMLSGERDG